MVSTWIPLILFDANSNVTNHLSCIHRYNDVILVFKSTNKFANSVGFSQPYPKNNWYFHEWVIPITMSIASLIPFVREGKAKFENILKIWWDKKAHNVWADSYMVYHTSESSHVAAIKINSSNNSFKLDNY